LRSGHSEKNPYTEIKEERRKSKPNFCWIIFVMPEDVSIGGNGIHFVI
jgi:hypothetical protein